MYTYIDYTIYIYIYISFTRTAICSRSSFTTDDISLFKKIEKVVCDDDTAMNTDNNFVLKYDSNTGTLQVRHVGQMRVPMF